MAEKIDQPTVVVLGASGQIGLFAVPRLVASGFKVIALSRTGRPAEFPDLAGVCWQKIEQLTNSQQSVLLLSAGPLELVSEVLGKLSEVSRLVAFSTTSVMSKTDSHDSSERAQMREILLLEADIADICSSRDMTYCLLRPTLIYGCGMDRNVSLLARLIRKSSWLPVAGGASGLRQPVHADDLASAAVAALSISEKLPPELNLCGGSTLSYRDMLHRIAEANDLKLRVLSVPLVLLSGILSVLRWVPGLRDLKPEMLRRQGRDLVFDDTPARQLLNYRPRPFRPVEQDFKKPEPAVLIRLADTAH